MDWGKSSNLKEVLGLQNNLKSKKKSGVKMTEMTETTPVALIKESYLELLGNYNNIVKQTQNWLFYLLQKCGLGIGVRALCCLFK